MINVSQNYLEKALAPGRNVRCMIFAGENIYTDADILSFEFNDVVHPEDMKFGTTCANRFQFEIWNRHNIPLTTVIRPVIGFADSPDNNSPGSEVCALGEFYITRRYRKRERYSVTCYDKMYRLDSRYVPSVTFPCTAIDILNDIAEIHGFEAGFEPEADIVEFVPRTTTCREVIGYIAGINGGFAKFDRGGILQLKKLHKCDFVLTRNQYTELSVKADLNEVRQVDFIVDDEIFSEGKGTKVSTYRQYNPFGSQGAAKRVFDLWSGFTYCGLTAKMRGLPFLESGDSILVQDDVDDTYYFALISDYSLVYDGGLTGRLVSKSKNPIDDSDEPMSQQRLIEGLSDSLRIRYMSFINDEDIIVAGARTALAGINFNLEARAFAVFNSQFSVTTSEDCTMTVEYFINNERVAQTPETSLTAGSIKSVCLYNCFRINHPGRCTLAVTARVNKGTAVIKKGELIATVSGQYMLGDTGPQRPEANIIQSIGKAELDLQLELAPRQFSEYCEQPELQMPKTMPQGQPSANLNYISLRDVLITPRKISARLLMDSMIINVQKLSDTRIMLLFSNVVTKAGGVINLSAFALTFGVIEVEIFAVEINNNEIFITTENLGNFSEVVIKYDRQFGNLISGATGNPLQSFNYILNLEKDKET
jgi:hypothetical protein